MTIQELIQNGAKIIDVRTPEEFMGGNVAGSINIPLNEVPQRIAEFEAIKNPIVLCCLSGGRSGQAIGFLQAQGIECYNGGGWMDVNAAVS
ncbi:MAG: rhodanese-like domain-containing protein [Bacteroidetes bacterium]|jgi:phage shock protein E|nr:rhodanese-like domain-containing protein [Bacteroidota bacterium]